mgnify:CR=1 FL=1
MPGLLASVDPDGLLEYSVVYTDRSLNHMSQRFQGVIVGSVLVLLLGAWLYRRFFKSRNIPP